MTEQELDEVREEVEAAFKMGWDGGFEAGVESERTDARHATSRRARAASYGKAAVERRRNGKPLPPVP